VSHLGDVKVKGIKVKSDKSSLISQRDGSHDWFAGKPVMRTVPLYALACMPSAMGFVSEPVSDPDMGFIRDSIISLPIYMRALQYRPYSL